MISEITKAFSQIQQDFILSGNQSLIENIKLLLYQTDVTVFDRIDFDDDKIYREPLLFAYFKNVENSMYSLDAILYGYTQPNLRPLKISIASDEFGRIYLPNIGWLLTNEKHQLYDMATNAESEITLRKNGTLIPYRLEKPDTLNDTSIEVLKYPISLLKQFYYDTGQLLVEVEITEITKKHRENLRKAWNLIRKHLPTHYETILLTTNRCVIFNVDSNLRNSFATLSAQGISFFNAYQDDYNEVFFVDDIAHQTGHIIFNAMIYEVENFLLVSPDTIIQNVEVEGILTESRDIHVIFHALYTYYTTFICLDACLEAGVFTKQKRHEALGRMSFYIKKCYQDISLIEDPLEKYNKTSKLYASKELFTANGFIIYNEIKKTYRSMVKKWINIVGDFDMSNQPYNFTYAKFNEINPYI